MRHCKNLIQNTQFLHDPIFKSKLQYVFNDYRSLQRCVFPFIRNIRNITKYLSNIDLFDTNYHLYKMNLEVEFQGT